MCSFSPRNGEVILKPTGLKFIDPWESGFSPRNGEVILKAKKEADILVKKGFSPRNGEVILKKKTS